MWRDSLIVPALREPCAETALRPSLASFLARVTSCFTAWPRRDGPSRKGSRGPSMWANTETDPTADVEGFVAAANHQLARISGPRNAVFVGTARVEPCLFTDREPTVIPQQRRFWGILSLGAPTCARSRVDAMPGLRRRWPSRCRSNVRPERRQRKGRPAAVFEPRRLVRRSCTGSL
jgi:hypothetical protein